MKVVNYDRHSKMSSFPTVKKLGAVSPGGEMTPFVRNGRLMRLELSDSSRGVSADSGSCFVIRDVESGEIVSRLGQGCYYCSGYCEGDTVYVLGTVSKDGLLSGEQIKLFWSDDLKVWSEKIIIENSGWKMYNTSMCRAGDGCYYMVIEAGEPRELVGDKPFTCFFAKGKNIFEWEMLPTELAYPKDRYIGGPFLRWSDGWFYLICVEELPCQRYTNYIYRTADFETWEIGKYNPILMPGDEDRHIGERAADLSPEFKESIKTGFISSNSDIDMCDFEGKTVINYIAGDQLGFYFMCEAVFDGTVAELLAAFFA